MTTRHLLTAALLATLFAPALAEEARGDAPTFHADAPDRDARGAVAVAAMRMNALRNAPYSALVVTERTQALADGNQIATRRTTMTCRDSAGRTRQEMRDADGDVVTVTIDDPVAGTRLVLHPRDRTAVRIERTRRDGLPQAARPPRADGGGDILVKRVEDGDDAEHRRIRRDVRIQVSKALAEDGTALRDMRMQLAPLMSGAFADVKWSSKAVTKDLGTREFGGNSGGNSGGIRAEGRLRSYEIPAGAIGNRNPIVVSDETWTAPDLQVTVYTKHSDPRSGDFVFRLENIRREEPTAALFAVPADYTVREAEGRWRDKAGRADK